MGVHEIQVIESLIVEGTFSGHAVSRVSHLLKIGDVKGGYGIDEHGHCEEGSDQGAKAISGDSVLEIDGELSDGGDLCVVGVAGDGVGRHVGLLFILLWELLNLSPIHHYSKYFQY